MEASLIVQKIDESRPLTIQNMDQSFVGFIEKELNEELYGDIVEAIKVRGWNGCKAFFYAIVDKSSETVKINPSRVLPVESW